MWQRIFEFLSDHNSNKKKPLSTGNENTSSFGRKVTPRQPRFKGNLPALKEQFETSVGASDDVRYREFMIAGTRSALLIFVDSLVDKKVISDEILARLMHHSRRDTNQTPLRYIQSMIAEITVTVTAVKESDQLDNLLQSVLEGNTVLAVEGLSTCWSFETKGFEYRQIEETKSSERAVRGSREGFVEPLPVNISLVRRRVRNVNLRVKMHAVGKESRTPVAVLYMEHLTNPEMVQAARERIDAIKVDTILESGQIEAFIRDRPYSLFPTVRVTTRPDLVAQWLMQGRVIVLTDNTPFALCVPAVLQDFFQTAEDYTHGFYESTVIRWVRLIAGITAPVVSAFYIALTAVHPELIPTELALSIAGSREGLPFPAIVEVLMMELTLAILLEATLRMPTQLGQTIGIVGGLVIGTAAAQAGIISNLMVIIVSVTAIATFAAPSYEISIPFRILRWIFAISAAVLGLYGVTLVGVAVLVHLCSLNSFGVAYLTPYAPWRPAGMRDSMLYRNVLTSLRSRPGWLRTQEVRTKGPYRQPRKGPQLHDED